MVKQTLRGPVIPVITNLNDDLSIDHGAISENVRYVVERGITTGHGVLLAAGAGGDFPMLTVAERKAVTETIAKAADGRAPVVVGAQDTNVDTVIEVAQWAEQIGAYAIQMAPGLLLRSRLRSEDLVRHALRHRPDHIVVGEVREAADLLQALNTGHGGSLTTVHANNADERLIPDRQLRHARRRGASVGSHL